MFQGFLPQAQEFLWGIRLHNERPWFLEHKEEYQTLIAQPMQLLAQEVFARFQEVSPGSPLTLRVSRIYRDARRLHGRGPYKDHMWFVMHRPHDREEAEAGIPAFFFELAPEGYSIGMGCYDASPLTMEKLRARIGRDPAPLETLARKLNRQKDYTLQGQEYKRPKGDPGPLLFPWYNRRSIALCRECNWEGTLFSSGLVSQIVSGFVFLTPYYDYLTSLSADPNPRLPREE